MNLLYNKCIWYVYLSPLFLEGLAVFGIYKSQRIFDGTCLDIFFHHISIETEALGAKEIEFSC